MLATSEAIQQAFLRAKQNRRPAFLPFIMAGYPNYEQTIKIALTLQESGADIIELGFPYSDPLADGPVLQEAAEHALKQGMTFSKGLELIRDLRKRGLTIPILAFCYYNPIYQYGLERFVQEAQEAGANGVLVPDLPHEEASPLSSICRENNFAFISLVAPTSKERIKQIVEHAQGFIYCISSLGVTGIRDRFSEELDGFLKEVRNHTSLPLAVGFGVSKKEHVDFLAPQVDGIIVGSAIVRKIGEHLLEYQDEQKEEEAILALKRFVSELFSK